MVDKARDEHGRGGNILRFKEAATNFQRLFYHILHGKGQRRQEKANMSLSYPVRHDDSKEGADICHDQHNHEYRNTAALNSSWSIQFPVNTLGILVSLPANIYILGSPYTPRSNYRHQKTQSSSNKTHIVSQIAQIHKKKSTA